MNMEDQLKQYWNGAHEKYADADWINKPTVFAEQVLAYIPSEGKLLDAGCGQGQDSRFFAEKGYEVTGIDFSPEGIARAKEKTPAELHVSFQEADLSKSLPFADGEFDIVHSHLAAHYFTYAETKQIMQEFRRVLKEGGVLTLLLNSVHDSEYGTGEKLEDDYFLISGVKKRYFSAHSLVEFIEGFDVLLLDEEGVTFKDRAIGNSNLVRFIGRKS